MKITKENYEFLMFELLEGNLSDSESRELLAQIGQDAFYQKEWKLMQQTIAVPDMDIIMPDKESLLKPAGHRFLFLAPIRIAASMLLLAGLTIGLYFYLSRDGRQETMASHTPTPVVEPPVEGRSGQAEQTGPSQAGPSENQIAVSHPRYSRPVNQNADSTLPVAFSAYAPESVDLYSRSVPDLPYRIPAVKIRRVRNLSLDKPQGPSLSKAELSVLKATRVARQATDFARDIPNLKVRMVPFYRNRRPGLDLEIKGEVIYASALIEIK